MSTTAHKKTKSLHSASGFVSFLALVVVSVAVFVVPASAVASEAPGGCPDEAVRQQDRSSALPDCRAYEMVTPPEKNGALINSLFADDSNWGPLIAGNGKDIMAPSLQCFANTESCTGKREVEGEPYEFTRTSQGWVTHALAPPATQFGITTPWGANADTHTTLFSAASTPESPDDFYLRKEKEAPVKIGPLSESFEAIGGGGIAVERLSANSIPIEATSDLSHVLFMGHGIWSLDGPENGQSIYEYAGQGRAKPLAVGVTGSLGSTDLISECGTRIGGGEALHTADAYNSLSEDGRTVYFTAVGQDEAGCSETATAPATDELYARIDGESSDAHTVLISAPTASGCKSAQCQAAQAEPQNAEFEGASRDGSRVFFTSAQQLSDDASQGEGHQKKAGAFCGLAGGTSFQAGGAGCNLYESVCSAPCGSHSEELAAKERVLIDVSAGAQGHGGPRVQGVMAISSDGSQVYFVARGKLAANAGVLGSGAQEGQDNLYVYSAGQPQPLRFIATLPPADEELFEHERRPEFGGGIELANVTPDGRFLVFVSHAALTADDTRTVGPAQIYRYDSQTSAIVRVSIGQDGFNDNGNAGSAGAENAIVPASQGWNYPIGPGRADPTMSDDGKDVFFESPVALTPGALSEVNVGGKAGFVYAENVYEYHDGNVSLISDGRDVTPNSAALGIHTSTRLVGADSSGKNVFFATNDQLTAQDTDTQRDYYDARVCEEGDPCVAPVLASSGACQEEACRGELSAPPSLAAPAGASFTAAGNLAPPLPAAIVRPKPKTAKCAKGKTRAKRGVCVKTKKKKIKVKRPAKRAGTERRAKS